MSGCCRPPQARDKAIIFCPQKMEGVDVDKVVPKLKAVAQEEASRKRHIFSRDKDEVLAEIERTKDSLSCVILFGTRVCNEFVFDEQTNKVYNTALGIEDLTIWVFHGLLNSLRIGPDDYHYVNRGALL
jgi:hypothetical protein